MNLTQTRKVAGLLVLTCLSLVGQGDRGAVTGMVTDSSGSAVPSVVLEVVNTGTNARFDTVSTSTGAYRVVGLPIGIYDLTAKASGFSTYIQLDAQVSKFFRITESSSVQFRSEFFNILNKTNFRAPNPNRSTPTFGAITSSYPARQIQFALKFLF